MRINSPMRALVDDPAFRVPEPMIAEIDRYVLDGGWAVLDLSDLPPA